MPDPIVNFAKLEVVGGYSATAFSVTVDDGAILPNPSTDGPFNLVWHNATDYPDPADDPDVEIVRVTGRTGNVLTLANDGSERTAQEGTVATAKNISGKVYNLVLAPTAKTIDDIYAAITAAEGRLDTVEGDIATLREESISNALIFG